MSVPPLSDCITSAMEKGSGGKNASVARNTGGPSVSTMALAHIWMVAEDRKPCPSTQAIGSSIAALTSSHTAIFQTRSLTSSPRLHRPPP